MTSPVLRLFGPPQLDTAAGPELLPWTAPTSLLYYLAAANRWVSRQELAYLYRPDEPEDVAFSYLRLQLHRAQRYPWAAQLEVSQDQIRWLVQSDLLTFRTAIAARDWQNAVRVAQQPFLASLDLKDRPIYSDWLDTERTECHNWLRIALLELARELESAGKHEKAVEQYRRLVDLDELDEAANTGLVQSLALSGERDQALKHYQQFADLLEQELAMEPAESTRAMADSVRAGTLVAQSTAPAARPPLPSASTSFIGRKAELEELSALLQDPDCQLLSIVGMGGAGKTRLGLELARRHADSFRDGSFFVGLQTASNQDHALRHISDALRLQGEEGADVLAALIAVLKDRELLLVLDNCEHIKDLGTMLKAIIAACPGVSILATSRQRLGLQGEWIFDLSGMSLKAQTAGDTPDAMLLFESAVRRVAPRLKMSDDDRLHAARICALVEGLPLAVELAAAWVRLMPIDRIEAEISSSFELLETDLGDLPERHRSLNSILQRTWNDLSSDQANTLMHFSVFQDGASLAATEAVTGARLPILLSLVNQSLLLRDDQGRFHSHPLLAQFSVQMLERDAELQQTAKQTHAAYFAGLLQQLWQEHDNDADSLHRAITPEIRNIESAWHSLAVSGDVSTLLTVAEALLGYYNMLGQYSHGLEICRQTIALLPQHADADGDLLKCVLLLSTATMLRELGDLDEALVIAREAAALAQATGSGTLEAKALRYEGDVEQMLGHFAEAETAYYRSQELYEQLGNIHELANTLNSLASLEAVQEKFEAATQKFERCLVLFDQVGDRQARAIALNNLGYLADAQGMVEQATLRYEESLQAFEQLRFLRGIAAVQNNLLVLYGVAGRLEEAVSAGEASLELKEQMNDRLGKIVTLKNLGDMRQLGGDPAAALYFYVPAIQLAHEIGAIPRLLQVLPGFAQALGKTGDTPAAERIIEALQRHPLTPPSARQKATEQWPHLPVESTEDEQLLMQALRNYVDLSLS